MCTKSPYAWVVLVMIGDAYVPGALVLAESILETNTTCDLVCMVTQDVSERGINALHTMYTSVVKVPYITMNKIPRFITAKQRKWYSKWINRSFTKWNIFDPDIFGQYEKVALLDADMVFVKNCDAIFDIPTPAQTFSTPWAIPYCQNGGIKNYYLSPRELKNGDKVPLDSIKQARKDGFVGRGSMVLATPDAALFSTIRNLITQGLQNSKCASGFDEQILADAYITLDITPYNIHQQYNWVVGKDMWLIPPCTSSSKPTTEPSVYQWYGIPKPWIMPRDSWPDLRMWWNIAHTICRMHSELSDIFTL
jgi:lipopolysaccharide biosynthesis glycosyltransferase